MRRVSRILVACAWMVVLPGTVHAQGSICGLFDVEPTKFGVPTQYLSTLSSKHGREIEHWNGMDVSFDARLTGGVRVQAGVSTGRTSTDNCEIAAKLPEIFSNATTALPTAYCHVDPEDFEPDAGTLIFGGEGLNAGRWKPGRLWLIHLRDCHLPVLDVISGC